MTVNDEMEELEAEEAEEESENRKVFKARCLNKYAGKKITSPLKAIREKCINCSGFQPYEVLKCTVHECTLYPFRFGRSPYLKARRLTEEELKVRAERMRTVNLKKRENKGQEAT